MFFLTKSHYPYLLLLKIPQKWKITPAYCTVYTAHTNICLYTRTALYSVHQVYTAHTKICICTVIVCIQCNKLRYSTTSSTNSFFFFLLLCFCSFFNTRYDEWIMNNNFDDFSCMNIEYLNLCSWSLFINYVHGTEESVPWGEKNRRLSIRLYEK